LQTLFGRFWEDPSENLKKTRTTPTNSFKPLQKYQFLHIAICKTCTPNKQFPDRQFTRKFIWKKNIISTKLSNTPQTKHT
jgi:hypothetical protein